ncbi:hypothetical protein ACBP45_09525 [Latilactobacillus sakei]
MSIELEWPRDDMVLDRINKNSDYIVEILNSEDLPVEFYRYSSYYFDAASSIMKYLVEIASKRGDIAKLDLWYFPMTYLYRHSFELLIKANIFKKVITINERITAVKEVRHNLKAGFKKILEFNNLEKNSESVWVMEFLTDISLMDRESDMFRYPFNNRKEVLFDKQVSTSLLETQITMNKAYDALVRIYNSGILGEMDNKNKRYISKLVIEDRDYYKKSVLGYKISRYSFVPYFRAYNEVGNFFRNKIIEENSKNLFLPMCYVYRNAIELGLKSILWKNGCKTEEETLKILKRKKHSLLGLWNSIPDEIKENSTNIENKEYQNVTQYIEQLHNLDTVSSLFRYPCDSNLKIYFKQKKKLDAENVAISLSELCNYLDAVDDHMEYINS